MTVFLFQRQHTTIRNQHKEWPLGWMTFGWMTFGWMIFGMSDLWGEWPLGEWPLGRMNFGVNDLCGEWPLGWMTCTVGHRESVMLSMLLFRVWLSWKSLYKFVGIAIRPFKLPTQPLWFSPISQCVLMIGLSSPFRPFEIVPPSGNSLKLHSESSQQKHTRYTEANRMLGTAGDVTWVSYCLLQCRSPCRY